jgi:hypothetical protein
MVWLNQGFNQSSLKPYVQSFCSLDYSMLCNVLGGDLECMLVMLERSPPYLCLYLFYLIKRNKSKNKQGLYRSKTMGSLNFIIIFYLLLLLLLLFLFYFMCSPNFLSFSINKAKVKFAIISIALFYLHSRLLLLFMKVILKVH